MEIEKVSKLEQRKFFSSPLSDAGIPRVIEADPNSESYRGAILSMSELQLMSFINTDLLGAENERYKAGNTAEHKLMFLVSHNVAKATTYEGGEAYTDKKNHPKICEIDEFKFAVSDYFERERNKGHVLSEVADIFYNLIHLSKMHPEFIESEVQLHRKWLKKRGLSARERRLSSDRYLHKEYQYMQMFEEFAAILGFSRLQALKLSAIKYHQRLLVGKDKEKQPLKEEEVLGSLEHPPVGKAFINFPTDLQLSDGFDYAEKIQTILTGYLKGIRGMIKDRHSNYSLGGWAFDL